MGRSARQVTVAGEGAEVVAHPVRTCAVTRAELSPDDLIRFVQAPDGHIVPDLAGRLPGRGVWITCARAAVEAACKSSAFTKALRRPVVVGDELPVLVEKLMVRRAIEALSLANKAGLVASGFAKTEAAIGAGACAALVHASDAAADGMDKLDRRFHAACNGREKGCQAAIITALTSEELSLAIGRPNVVHAALACGGAGRHFLKAAGRLQRYRGTSSPAKGPEAGAKTEKA